MAIVRVQRPALTPSPERLIMTKKTIAALTATTLALVLSAPAFAGTQDDVQSCRAALAAEGTLDVDNYRLSFKGKKGGKNRVLTLEAKPKNNGERYMVKCSISKSEVTDLALTVK